MMRLLEYIASIFRALFGGSNPTDSAHADTLVNAETLMAKQPLQKRPRNERNNNPGNIRPSNDIWKGAIGEDGGYLIFESPEMGLRAALIVLRTYFHTHNLRTVRGIVTRWAPPSDNNPTADYIAFVCRRLAVGPDQRLDYDTHGIMLLRAMVTFEGGRDPYRLEQYQHARALL